MALGGTGEVVQLCILTPLLTADSEGDGLLPRTLRRPLSPVYKCLEGGACFTETTWILSASHTPISFFKGGGWEMRDGPGVKALSSAVATKSSHDPQLGRC